MHEGNQQFICMFVYWLYRVKLRKMKRDHKYTGSHLKADIA